MSNNVFVSPAAHVAVGKHIRCKYPKHGKLNVLKFHEGIIEKVGDGPHGKYALVHSTNGQYRTLRCDKITDCILS